MSAHFPAPVALPKAAPASEFYLQMPHCARPSEPNIDKDPPASSPTVFLRSRHREWEDKNGRRKREGRNGRQKREGTTSVVPQEPKNDPGFSPRGTGLRVGTARLANRQREGRRRNRSRSRGAATGVMLSRKWTRRE